MPAPSFGLEQCDLKIREVEASFRKHFSEKRVERAQPPMPLEHRAPESHLKDEMFGELADSWNTHHESSCEGNLSSFDVLVADLEKSRSDVSSHETSIRAKLLATLAIPHSAGAHTTSLRLRQLANMAPQATTADLVRLACFPDHAQGIFNPCLLEPGKVTAAVNSWLQLCILSDKLERLVACVVDPFWYSSAGAVCR